MRQLITRVDDDLLDRVKERARREGVSMNTFVNRLLVEGRGDRRSAPRPRATHRGSGLTVRVTPSKVPLPRDEVIAMTRGAGTAASEALEWTRGER